MSEEFASIHNHHEHAVFAAVMEVRAAYPGVTDAGLLADVACVALNRLPARYIRHSLDYAFYLSERDAAANQAAVADAVKHAFEFVRTRLAVHARA